MRSQEVRTRRGAPGDARASVSLAHPRAHSELARWPARSARGGGRAGPVAPSAGGLTLGCGYLRPRPGDPWRRAARFAQLLYGGVSHPNLQRSPGPRRPSQAVLLSTLKPQRQRAPPRERPVPAEPTCLAQPGVDSPAKVPARPRGRAPAPGLPLCESAGDGGRSGEAPGLSYAGRLRAARAAAARGPARLRRATRAGAAGPAPSGRRARARLKWFGGSLFARRLWLGAWRWFTAWMPLNLFPGEPGSIRPGPERAVRRAA